MGQEVAHLEKVEESRYIILVVLEGNMHGFAHCFEGSEVNHGVKLELQPKNSCTFEIRTIWAVM